MAINYDYSSTRYKDSMTKEKTIELIKIVLYYVLLFVMGIYCIYTFSYYGKTVITLAILGILTAAIVSHHVVPTERPNQILMVKKSLLTYLGTLILLRFGISLLNGYDSTQLAVSLGFSTGQTTTNAYLGWLPMIAQFHMFGTPIGLIGYEVKRIMAYYGFGGFGNVTKRTRTEQLQRVKHK